MRSLADGWPLWTVGRVLRPLRFGRVFGGRNVPERVLLSPEPALVMPSWQGIPGTLAGAIPDKVPLLHETADLFTRRRAVALLQQI